jgi:hypothetical protein
VRCVPGASAYPEEEDASLFLPYPKQQADCALDHVLINLAKNLNAFLKVLGRVVHE